MAAQEWYWIRTQPQYRLWMKIVSVHLQLGVCTVHLPLCFCPISLGVTVQWGATAYTYSEDCGTVQLVLLKEGSTVSNVSVEVVTVAGNATGMTSQACQLVLKYVTTCFINLILLYLLYTSSLSAPEDYEAINSSTIIFSPTQTSAMVSVTIVDDDVLEDVEQFTVEVVATGGQERVDVGDAASVFISDDDCE